VLEASLRLTHPIMPYITEEIWQRVAPLAGTHDGSDNNTIMTQLYPVADDSLVDSAAVTEMEWVTQAILGVRRIKGEMNIAPGKPVPVLLGNTNDSDRKNAEQHEIYLNSLAKVESIEILAAGEDGPESATALVDEMKLLIPLAGLIDKDAELARLEKEMDKLQADIKRTEKKLTNPAFVKKAPEAVVNKERDKLNDAKSALHNLSTQADRIRAL